MDMQHNYRHTHIGCSILPDGVARDCHHKWLSTQLHWHLAEARPHSNVGFGNTAVAHVQAGGNCAWQCRACGVEAAGCVIHVVQTLTAAVKTGAAVLQKPAHVGKVLGAGTCLHYHTRQQISEQSLDMSWMWVKSRPTHNQASPQ